jgi:hypothetical protein
VVLSSISLRAVLGVIELALACSSFRIHWRLRALDAALGLPTIVLRGTAPLVRRAAWGADYSRPPIVVEARLQ